MPIARYTVRAKLWVYPGAGGWHFLTLPPRLGKELRAIFADERRGWGSLPVRATLGATTWKTSIFPEAKSKSYLLPVKAHVRRAEGVAAGDVVTLALEVGVA